MKNAYSTLVTLLFAAFFMFFPTMASASAEVAEETAAVTLPEGVDAVTPTVEVIASAADSAKVEEADTDAAADTDAVEKTDAELLEEGKSVFGLFKSQEWALFTSAIIMFALALVRRFHLMDRVPAKYVPLASAVAGLLVSLADALSTGGAITVQRVALGLMAGLTASGLWDLVGKYIPGLDAKSE